MFYSISFLPFSFLNIFKVLIRWLVCFKMVSSPFSKLKFCKGRREIKFKYLFLEKFATQNYNTRYIKHNGEVVESDTVALSTSGLTQWVEISQQRRVRHELRSGHMRNGGSRNDVV